MVTFRPRPSFGWAWFVLIGLLMLAIPAWVIALSFGQAPLPVILLNLAIGLVIGVPAFVLAAWFPTMRYELDDQGLTLRYGPVLRYRIPLREIRDIRRRNMKVTLWSSCRFPGLALFRVPYGDVGEVHMCATAAADRILLITTEKAKYGLTPADEEGLVAALRARLGG